jgi:predicted XRE-type DNA-binding protein
MLIDRLLAKVSIDDDGCWRWTAVKDRKGYGKIKAGGGMRSAHRVSYELHRGRIPDGKFVCHACDNRLCINPEHLFLGSHTDNMADMKSKGRQQIGTKNCRAKLSEADILAIRASEGLSQPKLAKAYGISQSHVSDIRAGKKWSHVG